MMASDMKIKAIAPWFGGKRTMAPLVATELGAHIQYFEPFCGSMAVLFAKDPSRNETVNDLHTDLINLSLCLQSELDAVWVYERCQRSMVGDPLLNNARAYFAEQPAEAAVPCRERAYWYFVSSWMSRNGVAGMERQDFQLAVRWTHGGGSPTVRWRSATESIPAWHQRLQNVVILNRDAFKIIPKFDDTAATAIYVDPPYPRESRSHGSYLHEFSEGDDLFGGDSHVELARLLGKFKYARVVISSYDCERVRELYAGWNFVNHAREKNLHNQNGRGSRRADAPEVLIINGPSYAKGTS